MMLHPDRMEAVVDMAVEHALQVVEYLLDNLIVDGKTFGDEPLVKPEEFVAFYTDLEARGVTSALEVVNPQLAERYRRQYERAAAELMGLR